MTIQVTADQLEKEFEISQESIQALAQRAGGQGYSIPTQGGTVNVKPNGRPASFGVWNWDGTPSQVPIAYDAGGTNPRIDRYLRKRHCNDCGRNGFITEQCKHCGSQDTVRFYYVRFEDVPFKRAVTGEIACLCSMSGPVVSSPPCVRHGKNGFLNRNQMLLHASSKHPTEYMLWQDMNRADANGNGSTNADIAMLLKKIEELEAKVSTKPEQRAEARAEAIEEVAAAVKTKADYEDYTPVDVTREVGGLWRSVCGIDGCTEIRENNHKPAVISAMKFHRREAHGG